MVTHRESSAAEGLSILIQQVGKLQDSQSSINEKLALLSSDLRHLANHVDGLSAKLEGNGNPLLGRVNSLEENVANMKSELGSAVVNVQADLSTYKEVTTKNHLKLWQQIAMSAGSGGAIAALVQLFM